MLTNSLTIARELSGRSSKITYARAWRSGCLALLLMLLGCAPIEVRVMDGNEPQAAEQARTEQAEEEEGPRADEVTEGALVTAVAYLTIFAEACGALIIGVALIQALGQYIRFLFSRRAPDSMKEDIRLWLGRSLALALEFALAADILKTAVAPSWSIIAQLAAIIVLRTLLNYFLDREIRQFEERRTGDLVDGRQPVKQ